MIYDYDIIVIGGGAAGLSITSGAAQLGAKVLLIEKDPPTKTHPDGGLGGDCLHYGCVPSKSLIKSAQVAHTISRAKDFGLPKTELKKINWNDIKKRIKNIQSVIQKHDSVKRFKGLGADVMFGTARFLNKHTIQIGDHHLKAKYFAITTGSRPSIPKIPGLDKAGYITNEEIFTLKNQPQTLAILGGGPIGSEMAQAFARLGTKVHIIEKRKHVLSREDSDIAAYVTKAFENDGVNIHSQSTIVRVAKTKTGKKKVTIEKLKGKSRKTVIEVDEILIAKGRTPNVDSLALENAGVKFSERGVKTNDKCQTNIKHIYAAGDCTGGLQFTHVAGAEAGIVVSNMMFKLPRKMNYDLVPWTTFTDPEVASVGLNESRAQGKNIKYNVYKKEFSKLDRALTESKNEGLTKILTDKKGRIIGAQIVGPHAGELIHEFIIAMNQKLKIGDIASPIHVYPTLAEISKQTASSYYTPKIFSDKMKWIVKHIFGFGKIK